MIIKTESLTKIYGNKIGCKDVNISVGKGQVFGFLGPNGAGKSTFVKMLVGLIYPTYGNAQILGKPLGNVSVRSKIGFLPENFRYQEWLTGRELLNFHASLAKIPRSDRDSRINEVLKLVKLEKAANSKIRTYSKGMQQRIGIAAALVADPELLFLDEPTSALDPVGRIEVREIIADLKDRGKSVFLNSHLLSEVEMVCDKVAIIKSGQVVEAGTLDELLKAKIEVEIIVKGLTEAIIEKLANIGKITGRKLVSEVHDQIQNQNQNERLIIELDNEDKIPKIASVVVLNGGQLYWLHQRKRSLEELFVDVVKGGAEQSFQ